jgi:signal transduction histidine kinase
LGVVDALVGIKNINDISGYFFEAVSMREIVEKSISKYRDGINKKNINFQVSIFNNIPLLTVDLKKISFVIDTLIENAIFYTGRDGKILINSISDSRKLTLFISDTGIGLGFIDKIKIFSKFYRNKKAKLMNPDGMGLRLYLSKQIIKRHNGKIYAKSNGFDEGTTFFVELPFHKK